jgi:hypothetical protein
LGIYNAGMTGSSTATIGGGIRVPPPGWARPTDLIRARLFARSIDDKLLNGSVSDASPVVIVRRARLLNRRYRRSIATAMRRLLEAARRRDRNHFRAQIQLQEEEILANGPLMLTLAEELEQEDSISPRGVILADRLITDGDSPVYAPTPIHHPPTESVESAVKRARAALHLG